MSVTRKIVISLAAFSGSLFAAEDFSLSTSMGSMLLSLLVVLALIFVLAALFKKLNINTSGNSAIKIVATQPLGTRERIVVIEVNGEQHLLGVTQNNVNHLLKLEQPLPNRSGTELPQAFKDKLQQFVNK